jgi:hypothetical protein
MSQCSQGQSADLWDAQSVTPLNTASTQNNYNGFRLSYEGYLT